MNLYIAKTYLREVMGIHFAKDINVVKAFYDGKNELPHTIEEVEISELAKMLQLTPLITILKSYESTVSNENLKGYSKIRIYERR